MSNSPSNTPTLTLWDAAAHGQNDGVRAALATGVNINASDPLLGLTALMLACRGGHRDTVNVLLECGAHIDQAGRGGLTALMMAAMSGQVAVVGQLLDAGADPAVCCDGGGQAVHLAGSVGAVNVLQLFEARDVPLFDLDQHRRTVEQYARQRGQDETLAFLDNARRRHRYQQLWTIRRSHALRTRLLGAPPSPEQRRHQTANALATLQEPLALDRYTSWPHPATPHDMRSITMALGPLSPPIFEQILLEHIDFLESGGLDWLGSWHSFEDEKVVFALNDGPKGGRGRRADLHLRDLSAIDGHRANLRGAHMIGILAEGVDFSHSNWRDAIATDSDLRRVDLEDATLMGADLSRSDLRGARLVGADLRLADLEGATLQGADLRGAKLAGANLQHTDLRDIVR